MNFKYGHLLEETLLTYAELAGHDVKLRQLKLTESMLSSDGTAWMVRGKIDAEIDGVLVDVKSCSKTAFNDLTGYYPQVRWYAETGSWKRAGILAIEKSSGRIRYEEVPRLPVGATKVQTYHGDLLKELGSGSPPSRFFKSGKDGKLPDGCLWCPHKYKCWPGITAYKYAYGPVFYVEKPVVTPRVPTMTQAEVESAPIR
jgi:hypothetical protein